MMVNCSVMNFRAHKSGDELNGVVKAIRFQTQK